MVSAQGDGWVRGYEATTGKKLWEFDTNPKDSVWPRTRNEIIATPVIYQNRVYIANGQDPEHGEGVGHFYAIDATKRGDITEDGPVFHFDKIRRSISTAAIVDGLIYIPDFSGFFHCLDANTGQEYWVHDLTSAIWGSALVADGKVYLGNEDGDIVILATGKEKKVIATDQHGQRRLRDRRAGEQRAVHHEPQPALQAFDAMTRGTFAVALTVALARGRVGASARAAPPARRAGTADAGAWPQFRGNARLTGVSTSAPPRTLKLLWKYEAGDSIDSSAAIVDGAVYVGSLTGDLMALDLATGKLRWKYATGGSIGESSPAVAGGTVYVGDGDGVLHAVRTADGQPVWTFKTTQEIKSSPVVAGEHGARRLLRRLSLRARRRDRKAEVEVRDRWVPCTPRRPCRTASSSSRAATRASAGSASRRQGSLRDRRRRQHRRVAGHRRRSRLLRHVQQRSAGLRHQGAGRFSGGTRTRSGSSRSTRRRRSSAAR